MFSSVAVVIATCFSACLAMQADTDPVARHHDASVVSLLQSHATVLRAASEELDTHVLHDGDNAGATFHSAGQEVPSGSKRSHPHILFLMADQLDGRVLDPESIQYQPHMPHLRRLAAGGAHFSKSYTASPLCVPARAAMMTGRHVSQLGVWNNDFGIATVDGDPKNLDENCVIALGNGCAAMAALQNADGTFVDVLAEGGYEIKVHGKLHVGGGLGRFEGRTSNKKVFLTAENVGFRQVMEWTREVGLTHRSGPFDMDGLMTQAKLYPLPENGNRSILARVRNPEDDLIYAAWPAPEKDYATADKCDQLLRAGLFMREAPQFLYCSFHTPHAPHTTNSTYLNMVRNLGAHAVPEWAPKKDVHPADMYTALMKGTWGVSENMDTALIDERRRTYFAQCAEIDHLIGRILTGLDKGGGKENSYVIFVADHGDHNYENRMIEKESMLEASSRVPIIISGPGIHPSTAPGRNLASLHDVYPTVIDMAGLKPRPNFAGQSLLELTAEGSRRKKHYVTAEYHARHTGTGVFMIRKDEYKMMLYGAPQLDSEQWPPQLYNLEKDPREFHNLADAEPDTVKALTKLLVAELDVKEIDQRAKTFDKWAFKKFWYDPTGGPTSCIKNMKTIYNGFDEDDAKKLTRWFGHACH